MRTSEHHPRVVRFGVFELDSAARHLRKQGVRLKLQDQPFRVLEAMLEKPGEIVTREQLKELLWTEDEFVEFDKSLNTAVQKIRQALGDSAESPRFIETIPRLGYRFVAPLQGARAEEVQPKDAPEPRRRFPWPAIVAVAVVATLAAGLLSWWLLGREESSEFAAGRLRQLTFDAGLTWEPTISSDGKLVAYSSDRGGDGGLDIWVQRVAGGDPIRLTDHPADDMQPDLSPDGETIVFRSARDEGGIYRIPTLGGDEVKIADRGFRPRWSPAGDKILFNSGAASGPVHVIGAGGGDSGAFPGPFQYWRGPTWLSNDRILVFGYFPMDWWMISLEGGGPEPIPTGVFNRILQLEPGAVLGPWIGRGPAAWREASREVVFSTQVGDARNLWKIELDRSWKAAAQPQPITVGSGEDLQPDLSDGDLLTFASVESENRIWQIPLDPDRPESAGPPERVTQAPRSEFQPWVSQDGTRTVFLTLRTGQWDIFLRNNETGKQTQLTDTLARESRPILSPDASQVFYADWESARDGRPGRYVLDVGRPTPREICLSCPGGPRAWLPDGSGIVWQGSGTNVLRISDVRTFEETVVVRGRTLAPFSPNVSWDGRWLTFKTDPLDSGAAAAAAVYAAPLTRDDPVEQEDWIEIVPADAFHNRPRWSPDGSVIYYLSDRDGFGCIWAIKVEPDTKLPQGEPFVVQHFHRPTLSFRGLHHSAHELSVARDKLVFEINEVKGNVWLMEQQAGDE